MMSWLTIYIDIFNTSIPENRSLKGVHIECERWHWLILLLNMIISHSIQFLYLSCSHCCWKVLKQSAVDNIVLWWMALFHCSSQLMGIWEMRTQSSIFLINCAQYLKLKIFSILVSLKELNSLTWSYLLKWAILSLVNVF